MRILLPLALLASALSLAPAARLFAWPLAYSAPEIRAQVVDAETGAPIEGAVVDARWMLFSERLAGSDYSDNVHEFEAVTDKDGWFRIPAWGPKPHSVNSHLTEFVPQFRIFKSGYFGRRFNNERVVKPDQPSVESDWNGKTMPLHRFVGEDWKSYVRSLNSMWSGSSMDDCFHSCPRMVLAMYAEWDRITPHIPLEMYRRMIAPPSYRTLSAEKREFLEQFKSQQ